MKSNLELLQMAEELHGVHGGEVAFSRPSLPQPPCLATRQPLLVAASPHITCWGWSPCLACKQRHIELPEILHKRMRTRVRLRWEF